MSRSDDTSGSNVDWTLMERRKKKRGRGGGTDGGGMDAWQQSVENRLGQLDAHVLDVRREITDVRSEIRSLRSDMSSQFRWLLGVLVVVFGALLGTMARGFGWF